MTEIKKLIQKSNAITLQVVLIFITTLLLGGTSYAYQEVTAGDIEALSPELNKALLSSIKKNVIDKCRIRLVPYYDEASCGRFKNTCTRRYRLVSITPSMTNSDYNNRRATIIVDKEAKKAYFLRITKDNKLKLIPTKLHISKTKKTSVFCTMRVSPIDADKGYYEKIEAQRKNSDIRQRRIIRLRPSIFKSQFNNKRTTMLVDITAKKIYFFWVDKNNNLKLFNVTKEDVRKYLDDKDYNFIKGDNQKKSTIKGGTKNLIDEIDKDLDKVYKRFVE